MNSAADIWERVLSLMQQTMTETTISTWFSDAEPVALDENRFILYIPTDFKREIVVSRYLGDIKKALYDLFSADLEVVILNEEEKEKQTKQEPTVSRFLPGTEEYTFERFVVGNSNKLAHAAALAVAGGGNPERLKSEAEFASLCGVAPLLASSGKTERHRLNRGGDRRANRALYQIAVTRMSYDQRTKDYVGKRKRDGKSKKEAIRCLKRYIAREVFRALRNPLETKGPSWKDLRPARQALGITLVEAGKALNVGFQRVSYAETGRLMNVRFLEEYDAWLKSQAKRES